jgi:tetratricopeptide (TPR) repeat protein
MSWGHKRGWGPEKTWEKSLLALTHRVIQATSSDPELQLEVFAKQLNKALAKGGPDSPMVAKATLQVANLLCTLGRPEEELPLREQHLAACRRNLGDDDQGTVQAEMRLATCLVQLKRLEEADPLLQHIVAVRTRELGSSSPETALALSMSAKVARGLGRFDDARDQHLKILEWLESQESVESTDLAKNLMQVASLLAEWREFDEASEFYRRAFEIRRLALGSDNPDTLISLGLLSMTTLLAGRGEEVRGLTEELVERCERILGAEARETVMAHEMLARINNHE